MDAVGDDGFIIERLFATNIMVVDKAAQASVEDAAVQPHEQFMFTRAGLGAALTASKSPRLADQPWEQSLTEHIKKSVGDAAVGEARKNEDPNEFTRQYRAGVVAIKFD